MANHVVEESRVDRMYDILVKTHEPQDFYAMADKVFEKGEIEADNGETIARLYTTLSLDGRFLSVGHNLWALRDWYPLEKREADVAKTLGDATHRKNKIAEDGFDDYDDDDNENQDNEDLNDDNDDSDDDGDNYNDNDDDVQRIRKNASIDDEEE
nr:DNA-directed RNA polymerase subunit delta [Sporolactobacillus vineae]